MKRWMIAWIVLGMLGGAGCAHQTNTDRPPAATFGGTLSEVIIPAQHFGDGWEMQQGLLIDDLAQMPTTLPVRNRSWNVNAFLKQKQAAGARAYGEIFYFAPGESSGSPAVKVSTLILVYQSAGKAQEAWKQAYGPGLMTGGYKRTNEYGDKSVDHVKHDDLVVLAGNVILQVSQPVEGQANEAVLGAYMKALGIERPALP